MRSALLSSTLITIATTLVMVATERPANVSQQSTEIYLAEQTPNALSRAAFVSTFGPASPGCNATSIIDHSLDEPILVGQSNRKRDPTGRIAINTTADIVLTMKASNRSADSEIGVLGRDNQESTRWNISATLSGPSLALSGGIAFSPKDEAIIVATAGHMSDDVIGKSHIPPYHVKAYKMPDKSALTGTIQLSMMHASVELESPAAVIIAGSSGEVHVLTENMELLSLDGLTLQEIRPRMQLSPFRSQIRQGIEHNIGGVYAVLSPDQRLIVTNRWENSEDDLNIADVISRRTWTVDVPDYLGVTTALAFNRSNQLLALKTKSHIAIFELFADNLLNERTSTPVGEGDGVPNGYGLTGDAIAWSGDGTRVLASSYPRDENGLPGNPVVAVFHFDDDMLTYERDIEVCAKEGYSSEIMDIVSVNNAPLPWTTPTPMMDQTRVPTPVESTPTTASTATSLPTQTAANSTETRTPDTPTTSASPDATQTVAHTPEPTNTNNTHPTARAQEKMLYLPLMLNGR